MLLLLLLLLLLRRQLLRPQVQHTRPVAGRDQGLARRPAQHARHAAE
jgi:hypothetical protein